MVADTKKSKTNKIIFSSELLGITGLTEILYRAFVGISGTLVFRSIDIIKKTNYSRIRLQ